MRKPTLHIITEYYPWTRLESFWKECFFDVDFEGYDVNIIDGSYLRKESFLWSDTFYKTTQLRSLIDMIHNNEVKHGDVFVFTNAWNFVAVPLSYFRDEYGIDFKMIGVWGNSTFNQNSPMYERFKRKNKKWGRQFELSLFQAYDWNCFFCEQHWKLFKSKYTLAERKGNWSVTGYPFEYLKRKVVEEPKEDVIIFPYEIVNSLQFQIFKGLRYELPQFKFVVAQEECNNRVLYTKFLRKCKVMFTAKRFEYNPVLIWEGMLNGVFPALPQLGIFSVIFPEKYLYPKELAVPKNPNKFLYLVRNRLQTMQYLKDVFEQYDSLRDEILEDARIIGDKYYSNKPFLEILNKIHD